jgi:hypothetical protein
VVRQYVASGDDWTPGDIHLWGACLQQGDDPQAAYARSGVAALDSTASPLKVHGPGPSLADNTLLELTANGELIVAGGSGNGYRLAALYGRQQPQRLGRCLGVKSPDGTTLGHILLYTNP